MEKDTQKRLLEFLKASIDKDGTTHFLAVSAVELGTTDKPTARHQVRVAVTFQAGGSVCPYFDGTDMYVEIEPSTIQFAREHEWADGPPIMEGSPNELALSWVSQLSPPFHVSPDALEASLKGKTSVSPVSPTADLDGIL